MSTRFFQLPAEEPPEDIKAALRLVLAWARVAMEREEAAREGFRMKLAAAQNIRAPRDWRDEL